MNNKEIIVKDNVGIVMYSAAVKAIVEKFFDDENNYTPHFGRTNSIAVFFNYFVDGASFDNYFEDVEGEIDTDFLFANEDCLNLYNKALRGDGTFRLDFCNAYADAMKIVDTKKTSFGSAISIISSMINKIFENVSPLLTEDNINVVSQIAKDMSEGKISAEAIVDAYANRMAKSDNTDAKTSSLSK